MTSPPSQRAAELFLHELASSPELSASLERLCAAHPELASDLRALATDWRRVESVLEPLGLLRLLRRGPRSAPAEAAGTPPSSVVERRVEELLSALALSSPQHRYEIKEEVARGGQGLVYRVWDGSLRRELAMKVLLERHRLGDPEETSRSMLRFLEEAHVNGQLDHPGVVPVHELGLDDEGRAYFTMKLVRGQTLAEVFELARDGQGGWNRTRVASVLLKVCEAMSYAHAKGVIHRDLKPSNVMVGRFGEVFVMDWGLARLLGKADTRDIRLDTSATSATRVPGLESATGSEEGLRTMDGRVVGTPAYMPPEQARGEVERVNACSDIYSLGAMLYHLLTGKPPYCEGEARPHVIQVLNRCASEPPVPVHALAPDAPRELEAIAARAMAREPARRYPTMEALAEDLRAYLEGRVVSAYESGHLAALKKWVARNRGLAAASLAALLLLVGGLAVSLVLGSEAARQHSNVLRLSAFRRMEELRTRAEGLWPAMPEHIPDYERWLGEARALVAELDETEAGPGHRALLSTLRARATPRTGAGLEAAERAHPLYPELLARRAERAALEHAESVRRGEKPERCVLSVEVRALPVLELNDLAWNRVKPERSLFGHEVEALAMAELALEKASPQDDRALLEDTRARACFVNGLDDEAMQAAQAAVELAPAAQKAAYEARVERLENDVSQAHGDAAARRLELLARRERVTKDALDAAVAWTFPDEQTAWWHGQLARLVSELEGWMDPETGLVSGASSTGGWGIERRLAMAQRIRERTLAGEEARTLWAEASGALAADSRFGGLALAPQAGLLPLGPDPRSGLWEFADLASGEVPRRRADGSLEYGEESALVLVLLPGGSFVMGAQGASPSKPGYDPQARFDEGPPGPIELAPFFCSKFELTQAQWERLTCASPSVYRKGVSWGGIAVQGTHPVENVSWEECVRALNWIDLLLPTEAQWEYAARAGTSTPWSSGAERESLAGHANLADRAADRTGSAWPAIQDWPELDDGFAAHAPVGSFLPNAFGLHDVHGNVAEWCRDVHRERSYTWPARPGDGLRAGVEGPSFTARGGSFVESAAVARSAYRLPFGRDARGPYLGLRPVRELRP